MNSSVRADGSWQRGHWAAQGPPAVASVSVCAGATHSDEPLPCFYICKHLGGIMPKYNNGGVHTSCSRTLAGSAVRGRMGEHASVNRKRVRSLSFG